LQQRLGNNGRIRESGIVNNGLTHSIRNLTGKLREVNEKIKNPDERQELRSARDKISALCFISPANFASANGTADVAYDRAEHGMLPVKMLFSIW